VQQTANDQVGREHLILVTASTWGPLQRIALKIAQTPGQFTLFHHSRIHFLKPRRDIFLENVNLATRHPVT
jgi:hypothetical protein